MKKFLITHIIAAPQEILNIFEENLDESI